MWPLNDFLGFPGKLLLLLAGNADSYEATSGHPSRTKQSPNFLALKGSKVDAENDQRRLKGRRKKINEKKGRVKKDEKLLGVVGKKRGR